MILEFVLRAVSECVFISGMELELYVEFQNSISIPHCASSSLYGLYFIVFCVGESKGKSNRFAVVKKHQRVIVVAIAHSKVKKFRVIFVLKIPYPRTQEARGDDLLSRILLPEFHFQKAELTQN